MICRSLLLSCLTGFATIITSSPVPQDDAYGGTDIVPKQGTAPKEPSVLHTGINVDTATCDQTTATRLEREISDIRYFAEAALAVVEEEHDIYNYFFFPDDMDVVKTVFSNIISYTKNQLATIIFGCDDPIDNCKRNITGYYIARGSNDGAPHNIHFCPHFIELDVHPNPCDEDSLGMEIRQGQSKIRTMIHEMIHITGTGGPTQPQIQDKAYTAYSCHTLVTKHNERDPSVDAILQGKSPRNNADSYALFATWIWIKAQQQTRCPGFYPLWNATSTGGGIFQVRGGESIQPVQVAANLSDLN